MTVGEATRDFSVSKPAISRHLRVLEQAGAIVRVIDGRTHRLRLAEHSLTTRRLDRRSAGAVGAQVRCRRAVPLRAAQRRRRAGAMSTSEIAAFRIERTFAATPEGGVRRVDRSSGARALVGGAARLDVARLRGGPARRRQLRAAHARRRDRRPARRRRRISRGRAAPQARLHLVLAGRRWRASRTCEPGDRRVPLRRRRDDGRARTLRARL